MVKVSVMYPNGVEHKFDMAYYLNSHMPMVRRELGGALKGVSVDEGLGGAQPGSAPKYLVICNLLFESVETFQLAFATHGQTIVADIPNYTNTQPIIQINEVKL
jgi:uncharacterized protein (TIGR02118 family)